MIVISLIGLNAGKRIDVSYEVAQANVASLGGNGNMCLPHELDDIRVRGLDKSTFDLEPYDEQTAAAIKAEEDQAAAQAEAESPPKPRKARKPRKAAGVDAESD